MHGSYVPILLLVATTQLMLNTIIRSMSTIPIRILLGGTLLKPRDTPAEHKATDKQMGIALCLL